MPIPLIAVVSALAAGGTLVPHADGGMIVTAAGGYVAGTYLSTTAIAGVVAAATATLGGGALAVTSTASTIAGSAAVVGTVGAAGTAAVAGPGPVAGKLLPLAIGAVVLLGIAVSVYLFRLRRKTRGMKNGEEVIFSEREARVVQVLLLQLSKETQSK